eukprot:213098-Chlamydomonas_euryale.AAC.2
MHLRAATALPQRIAAQTPNSRTLCTRLCSHTPLCGADQKQYLIKKAIYFYGMQPHTPLRLLFLPLPPILSQVRYKTSFLDTRHCRPPTTTSPAVVAFGGHAQQGRPRVQRWAKLQVIHLMGKRTAKFPTLPHTTAYHALLHWLCCCLNSSCVFHSCTRKMTVGNAVPRSLVMPQKVRQGQQRATHSASQGPQSHNASRGQPRAHSASRGPQSHRWVLAIDHQWVDHPAGLPSSGTEK